MVHEVGSVTDDGIMRCRKDAICMPHNYGKNADTHFPYLMTIASLLIVSDLVKCLTATVRRTEKLRSDWHCHYETSILLFQYNIGHLVWSPACFLFLRATWISHNVVVQHSVILCSWQWCSSVTFTESIVVFPQLLRERAALLPCTSLYCLWMYKLCRSIVKEYLDSKSVLNGQLLTSFFAFRIVIVLLFFIGSFLKGNSSWLFLLCMW
jgi:hypothetical protein